MLSVESIDRFNSVNNENNENNVNHGVHRKRLSHGSQFSQVSQISQNSQVSRYSMHSQGSHSKLCMQEMMCKSLTPNDLLCKGPFTDDIKGLMEIIVRGTVICMIMVLCAALDFALTIALDSYEFELMLMAASCIVDAFCMALFLSTNVKFYYLLCRGCHKCTLAFIAKVVDA